MPKSITHLRTKENLKMRFLLTSLLKALTKPEDGNSLLLVCTGFYNCRALGNLDNFKRVLEI